MFSAPPARPRRRRRPGSSCSATRWFQLLIAGALGLIFTQFAFLAHEASHRQIFESGPPTTGSAGCSATGVVGISYSWWMNKHTRHHANPNKIGKDPDIEIDTISFLEEDAATAAAACMALITRSQGYAVLPAARCSRASTCTSRRPHRSFGRGQVEGPLARAQPASSLRFAVYLGAVFWFLPLGMAFAFLGVQLAVFGLYMGASFAPNHKGMPIVPADAKLDFFTQAGAHLAQRLAAASGRRALMGGLNYQVEHHLFPNMPRPHLAKAREIVREHCRTLDVPYTETTLLQSYGIVIQYLNRVGLAARDPFDCPMVNQFRRV